MHEIMQYRPPRHKGAGDIHLSRIAGRIQSLIETAQKPHECRLMRLSKVQTVEMAMVLAEFGEDLHNDIGLWAAYEAHNMTCFGTALPLTPCPEPTPGSSGGITRERVLHLMWVLYSRLLPGVVLAPGHKGISRVTDSVAQGLLHCFSTVPKDSGVKRYLDEPNPYGWDVKNKLIWLGTRSYLFRPFYELFRAKNAAQDMKNPVSVADDFICQQCTEWSGLSANDVLATVLALSESDREDLRNWSYRHIGAYIALTASPDVMKLRNVISDGEYSVRMSIEKNPFTKNSVILGSLVPWRGEWLWSGTQDVIGAPTEAMINTIKETFPRHNPTLIYRYCRDQEAAARTRCQEMHETMVNHFGGPLVVFPDAQAMEVGMQEAMDACSPDLGEDEVRKIRERHGHGKVGVASGVSKALHETKRPIGVYCHPDGVNEIMERFDVLEAALSNTELPLRGDELACAISIIQSRTTSPDFVRHVAGLYGAEAIRDSFALEGHLPVYWLEYLLRRFKGEFYKKRYPSLVLL